MGSPVSPLLALAFILLSAGPALGHAYLLQTVPAANSRLSSPPKKIEVRFDSAIEQRLSQAVILDKDGREVGEKGGVPASDPKVLELVPKGLPPGRYTIAWKVVSSLDGHVIKGAFTFAVGRAGSVPAQEEKTADYSAYLALAVETLAHWISLLAVLTLVGGAIFLLAAVVPARDESTGRMPAGLQGLLKGFWRAFLSAALIFLATSAALLLFEGMRVAEVTPWALARMPGVLVLILTTAYGKLWIGRCLLAIGLLVAALVGKKVTASAGPNNERRTRLALALTVALGSAVLMTLAASSHAGSLSGGVGLPVLIDALHLGASAVWVGGLICLAFVFLLHFERESEPEADAFKMAVAARFSPLAAASAFFLVITGIYNAWQQVSSPASLFASAYGITLLGKLLLALVMGALGVANRATVRLTLQLREAAKIAPTWLAQIRDKLTSRIELEALCGIFVVLGAAALTMLPPPRLQVPEAREALAGQPEPPAVIPALIGLAAQTEDSIVELDLVLARPEVGRTAADQEQPQRELEFWLKDRSGRPLSDVTRAVVKLSSLDADLGIEAQEAIAVGVGRFWGQLDFPSDGRWQIETVYKRRGREYGSALFLLNVKGNAIHPLKPPLPRVELATIPNPPRLGRGELWFTVADASGNPASVARLDLEMAAPMEAPRRISVQKQGPGKFMATAVFDRRGLWGVRTKLADSPESLGWGFLVDVLGPQEKDVEGRDIYRGTGRILDIWRTRSPFDPKHPVVVIHHDPIKGLMGAHAMPFLTQSPELLKGLRQGDRIRFTLTATADALLVTEVEKLP